MFSNLRDEVLQGTKTAADLSRCSECTKRIFSKRETWGINTAAINRAVAELRYGTSYWKKSQVEVLPHVGLIAHSVKKKKKKLWAMQHRWKKLWRTIQERKSGDSGKKKNTRRGNERGNEESWRAERGNYESRGSRVPGIIYLLRSTRIIFWYFFFFQFRAVSQRLCCISWCFPNKPTN